MLKCCRPLGVEVYKLTDPETLKGWEAPTPVSYTGLHGISLPSFQA